MQPYHSFAQGNGAVNTITRRPRLHRSERGIESARLEAKRPLHRAWSRAESAGHANMQPRSDTATCLSHESSQRLFEAPVTFAHPPSDTATSKLPTVARALHVSRQGLGSRTWQAGMRAYGYRVSSLRVSTCSQFSLDSPATATHACTSGFTAGIWKRSKSPVAGNRTTSAQASFA